MSDSPIDLERIQDATGGDMEFMKELVDIFIEDAQLRIREIRQALDASNFDDLGKTAHKLKGSSANLGAVGVSSMAKTLEELGKQQELDRASQVLEGLVAEMSRVESTLNQIVAGS
jgi:two-component system, sensor histidine kinase and response regulator